MWLIPYRSVQIKTHLPFEETRQRLASAVDTRPVWRSYWTSKYFRGHFSNQEFRFVPVTEFRNTYQPYIRGEISPAHQGTKISITISLSPLAAAMVLFLFVTASIGAMVGGAHSRNLLMGPFIVVGLHVLFYFIGFLPESRRDEEFLRDLLGAYD
jgi:hypothetical protein